MNFRKYGKSIYIIFLTAFSAPTLAGGLAEKLNSQSAKPNPSHTTGLPDYTQQINSSKITFRLPSMVENPYVIPFFVDFPPVGSDEYVQVSIGGEKIMKVKPAGNVILNSISSRFKGIDNAITVSIYKSDGTVVAQRTSQRFEVKDGQRAIVTDQKDSASFEYREKVNPGVYKSLMRYDNSKNHYISQYNYETDKGNVEIEGSNLMSMNPYIEFQGNFSTAKFTSMVPSN